MSDVTGILRPVFGHAYCEGCVYKYSNGSFVPPQFKCPKCSIVSIFHISRLNLRFIASDDVICGACNVPLTDDMNLYLQNGEVNCCSCVPDAAGITQRLPKISLSYD